MVIGIKALTDSRITINLSDKNVGIVIVFQRYSRGVITSKTKPTLRELGPSPDLWPVRRAGQSWIRR
jgi:hypothetical protein